MQRSLCPVKEISIHALREEGDAGASRSERPQWYFYPRPPRGGRPLRSAASYLSSDFYPRPPRGGRQQGTKKAESEELFLSTPSARRATYQSVKTGFSGTISIHALREEGDRASTARRLSFMQFLSTPSARRATFPTSASALSRHHFYPRPPRGGRRKSLRTSSIPQKISIHALREEGDEQGHGRSNARPDFYPRPPRGGRHMAFRKKAFANEIFLSTPSARRATLIPPSLSSQGAQNFYPRPPRGGRHKCRNPEKRPSDFYPRPPRGGRPSAAQGENRPKIFLSTPSARRATINLL